MTVLPKQEGANFCQVKYHFAFTAAGAPPRGKRIVVDFKNEGVLKIVHDIGG
jgi:hypothetical protein